jgi:hypothetical protein
MGPFSLFAPRYQSGIAENLHVVRQSRLADFQFVEQHTGTFFAAFENVEYFPAVFIPKRFENHCSVLIARIHPITSY